MKNWFTFLVPASLLLFSPARCLAVNFYDGSRAPEGLYFLTYTSLYHADELTDQKGEVSKHGYGYRKLEELLRLCWYKKSWVFTILVPIARVSSGYCDASSRGPGDLSLGLGGFLPAKQADILPMLFIKLPTGSYSSGRTVNCGSNQYDIKPAVFFYKAWGRFSIDASAKYFFRLENPSTHTAPGDELHLQHLLGWSFTKWFKAGPSLSWMKSGKRKVAGEKAAKSGRECLSAGADFYFRLPAISLTFTFLRDVHSKNQTRGDYFQLKTVKRF